MEDVLKIAGWFLIGKAVLLGVTALIIFIGSLL